MTNKATIFRMLTHTHICPYGLKGKDLLQREGFDVDDRILRSRLETDEFQREYEVETTPQIFIGDRRIGGYGALRAHLGKKPEQSQGRSYTPISVVFAVTLGCAAALVYQVHGHLWRAEVLIWFLALAMAVLAILKLRDLSGFTNQFITYDLLAMRMVRYAYFYPVAEAVIAICMLAGVLVWLVGPVAIAIGTIGALSVVKAVYVDQRDLSCACVGGDSRVPLGFVSLSENLAMVGMGLYALANWL